jgi:hypothetical protein
MLRRPQLASKLPKMGALKTTLRTLVSELVSYGHYRTPDCPATSKKCAIRQLQTRGPNHVAA